MTKPLSLHRVLCAPLAAAGLFLPLVLPVSAAADPYPVAVLQGLDKVTARISTFKAPLDTRVSFGALEITVRHCDKRPPEETPESTAFIEIREVKTDAPAVDLFSGWMFASSPAISALEHAVYDVWVLDCSREASAASESAG